jgi:tetratricopeptide (TPR) repeat protein
MLADSLIKIVPQCATAYKLRGDIYSAANRHLEALADFETAAGFGPNDPETYVEIGFLCESLGENEKAVEAFQAAIRLNSAKAGPCHFNMGIAYRKMGKFEQACACFEESKKLGFLTESCDKEIAKCRQRLK